MKKSQRTKELIKHQKWITKQLEEKGECILNEYCIAKGSKIHGYGVFARKNIPKETKVIEYVGEKIPKYITDKRSKPNYVYVFTLNKIYDIDGKVGGNGSEYINHSCDPNCETDVIDNRIWIISFKAIKKGEELTYDYGYEFDDDYEDHPCKCGSKKCIGFIVAEDDWPKMRKFQAKNMKN